MSELVLVTTADCHFCDRAREVLRTLNLSPHEVAVDSLAAHELASAGIPLAFLPVLTDGVRLLAYGRFSERRLRNELGL